jgi:ribonuclease R
VREFLGELGLDLGGGEKPTPDDYQRLLAAAKDRDDASVIQTMLLRSLSQAVYQAENKGHFGLHYPAYAHFTSPIRRYPDLLVHRAIRSLIRGGKFPKQTRRSEGAQRQSRSSYPYELAAVTALGERCSLTERRADDATREVDAWLKCEFLRDRVGEQFSGVIVAVTAFGIFVELKDLYIEGLVHISALPGDYYHFDAPKQRLVGDRTRRTFQLGGAVEVTVARVDLDERKIDLEMVGASDARPSKGRKGAGAAGKKRGAAGKSNANESRGKSTKKSSSQGSSKVAKSKTGSKAGKKQGSKSHTDGAKSGRSKR